MKTAALLISLCILALALHSQPTPGPTPAPTPSFLWTRTNVPLGTPYRMAYCILTTNNLQRFVIVDGKIDGPNATPGTVIFAVDQDFSVTDNRKN